MGHIVASRRLTAAGIHVSSADFATEELVSDPGVRPLVQATALIVGALVLGATGWMAVTPVQEVAVAFGEIVPASAVQAVQHLEGGIVQELSVKTAGVVVVPGGLVARIVPLGEELVADVRVSTRDIGFVAPGQPVKVKVAAFDYARFGRVEGTLKSVSPTTFFDQDKTPYYQGRVTLAANHVGDNLRQHLLLPGMTVEADIATGEKTVLQYLLKPIYTTLDGALRER
ncbi:putative HlyD family type I secretion protein [Azospirillum agricola]|uniref:HlyD family secretion protein n=1 Tax=Azospirillum agricola TaxID=1720247 RepID=UPI000A0F2768|nr:HlyD family secretion protein [Azospirillum agricola]SMH62384.1 type I secretion membrane fusion protein, HlyD family [Azospirillum lipoferum]